MSKRLTIFISIYTMTLCAFLVTGAVSGSCPDQKWVPEKEPHIIFGDSFVKSVEFVEKEIYAHAVKQLPICCVDIFLYDPVKRHYCLLLRKTPPAQGIWWFPGGRLRKGESFFECARRKCRDELGVTVQPIALLGNYSTIFPDSAWDCQTHTVNTVILAVCSVSDQTPLLDEYHSDYSWRSLEVPPGCPYLDDVYYKALAFLQEKEDGNGHPLPS